MEKMLNDYLQYAKSQTEESSTSFNINDMIKDLLKNYDKNKYDFLWRNNYT